MGNLNNLPSLTVTHAAVTVGNSSTAALAANANRAYAILINDSNEIIYINLGGTAVSSTGIRLAANGGSYEIRTGNIFTGAINAICASGGKTLLVTEGV